MHAHILSSNRSKQKEKRRKIERERERENERCKGRNVHRRHATIVAAFVRLFKFTYGVKLVTVKCADILVYTNFYQQKRIMCLQYAGIARVSIVRVRYACFVASEFFSMLRSVFFFFLFCCYSLKLHE